MTTTLGGLVLVTPPAEEPVSLEEMKMHLRVDIPDDDLLIESMITAAREYVEMFTRRQLVIAAWGLTLDAWPTCVRPPRPPLQEVVTLDYRDSAGVSQTLDPALYQVDPTREPGRILPASGTTWPAVQAGPGAVQLLYRAGYGGAGNVPQTFKAAIKLLVGDLYEHREARDEKSFPENITVCRLLWGVSVPEFS